MRKNGVLRKVLGRLGGCGAAGLLVVCVVVLIAQNAAWANPATDRIPFGSLESLDGCIGSEWQGAYARGTSIRYQRTSCACSATYFPATVYLFHDEYNLYLGLRMCPGPASATWGQFRAFVLLDNGDSAFGNVGDDLLILPVTETGPLTGGLDYHYTWYAGSPLLGHTLDAQQDTQGFGMWHAATNMYDFEFCLRMASGDPQDVAITQGRPFSLVIGFEVYNRYGSYLYSGQAPALTAVVSR